MRGGVVRQIAAGVRFGDRSGLVFVERNFQMQMRRYFTAGSVTGLADGSDFLRAIDRMRLFVGPFDGREVSEKDRGAHGGIGREAPRDGTDELHPSAMRGIFASDGAALARREHGSPKWRQEIHAVMRTVIALS